MKITELDELETSINEIGCSLDKLESLSKILLDSIHGGDNLKPKDIDNLTSILAEKISDLKQKFNSMETKLIF